MPILNKETDLFPEDLLIREADAPDHNWYCVYTLSRRDKEFMRRLFAAKIAFYGPVVEKRYRSPGGKLRRSFVTLFPNYVFMFATEKERYQAMTTQCVSSCQIVEDAEQLVDDLRNIHLAISTEVPLSPESKIQAGEAVVVRAGPFSGYEGLVIRREGKTRLLLAVNFLGQGVSMEFDEAMLEST